MTRIIFLIFLFAVIFMAWFADWEYDESWTFDDSSRTTIMGLVTYQFKEANNHILNSLWFKLLQGIGTSHVFFYRVLTVLGFVLFYRGASGILKLTGTSIWWITVLIIAPYFMYFTLGRGYSLALGCMVMALYYLLRYIESPHLKYEYIITGLGIICSLSVFSFLFATLPLMAVLFYCKRKKLVTVHTLIQFVLLTAMMLYVYSMGKIINQTPDIIASGSLVKNGTLSSLLSDFSYYNNLGGSSYYKYVKLLVALCFLGVLVMVGPRSGNNHAVNIKNILQFFIPASLVLMFAAHLLGAKYPTGRAVYYLHFALLLICVLSVRKFILPLIVIGLISFIQVIALYADLFKPPMDKVIRATGDCPLYVLGHNRNIIVTNKLGVHKRGIVLNRDPYQIADMIKNDTGKKYLLVTHWYKDSVFVPVKKVMETRKGAVLYEVINE